MTNINRFFQHGQKAKQYRIQHFGRLIESIARCENNLLERFHASIWFYLFSSTMNYSSISLYMPIVGLMLLLPACLALHKWVESDLEIEKSTHNLFAHVFAALLGSFLISSVLPYLVANSFPHWLFYAIAVGNIFPISFPIMSQTSFPIDERVRKVESTLLLAFSLQCGLVSLVCFPQGLILLVSSLFIVAPFLHSKVPRAVMLLAHPVVLLTASWAIYNYLFETSQISTMGEVENATLAMYSNENSNVYQLWMYSALPIWSALWTCRNLIRPGKLKVS